MKVCTNEAPGRKHYVVRFFVFQTVMFGALSRSTLTSASRSSSIRCISATPTSLAKKKPYKKLEDSPPPPGEVVPPHVEEAPSPSSEVVVGTPKPPPTTVLSLDFSPDDLGSRTTGAKSAKDNNMTSSEKQRRAATRNMLLALGFGAIAHAIWMGGDWEEEELKRKRWVCSTLLHL